MTLTAVLKKTDGSPHNGQNLSVTVSEPLLHWEADDTTDDDGNFAITVTREDAAWDPTKPMETTIRVSFGLVTTAVAVSL